MGSDPVIDQAKYEELLKRYKEQLNGWGYLADSGWVPNFLEQTLLPSGKDNLDINSTQIDPDFLYANHAYIQDICERIEDFTHSEGIGYNIGPAVLPSSTPVDDKNKPPTPHAFDQNTILAHTWNKDRAEYLERALERLDQVAAQTRSSGRKQEIAQLKDDIRLVIDANNAITPTREKPLVQISPESAELIKQDLNKLIDLGVIPEDMAFQTDDALFNQVQNFTRTLFTPDATLNLNGQALENPVENLRAAALAPSSLLGHVETRTGDFKTLSYLPEQTSSQADQMPTILSKIQGLQDALNDPNVAATDKVLDISERLIDTALAAGIISPEEHQNGLSRLHLIQYLEQQLGDLDDMNTLSVLRALEDAIEKGHLTEDQVGPELIQLIPVLRDLYENYQSLPPEIQPENAPTDDYAGVPDGSLDLANPSFLNPDGEFGADNGLPPGLSAPDMDIRPPDTRATLDDEEIAALEEARKQQEKIVRQRINTLQDLNEDDGALYISALEIADDGEYVRTLPQAYNDVEGSLTNPIAEAPGLQDTLKDLHTKRLREEGGGYFITVGEYDDEYNDVENQYYVNENGDIENTENNEVVGNILVTGLYNTHMATTELMRWGMQIDETLADFRAQVNEEHIAYQQHLIEQRITDITEQTALLNLLQDTKDFNPTNPDYDPKEVFMRNARVQIASIKAAPAEDFDSFLVLLWNNEQMRRDDLLAPNYVRLAEDEHSFPLFHKYAAMHDILHYSATNGLVTGDILSEFRPTFDKTLDDRLFPPEFYKVVEDGNGWIPNTMDVSSEGWIGVLEGTSFEGKTFLAKSDIEKLMIERLDKFCENHGIAPGHMTQAMLGGDMDSTPPIPALCPYLKDVQIVYDSMGDSPAERNAAWNKKYGNMNFDGTVKMIAAGEERTLSALDIATRRFVRIKPGRDSLKHIFKELTAEEMSREDQADLSYEDVKKILDGISDPDRKKQALDIFDAEIDRWVNNGSVIQYINLNSVRQNSPFNFFKDYADTRAEKYVPQEKGDLVAQEELSAQKRKMFQDNNSVPAGTTTPIDQGYYLDYDNPPDPGIRPGTVSG